MVSDIGKIEPRRIEAELRSAYLDYAMSVIVSRALPDVRDGLKPVQRRILFAMDELSMNPGSAYKKSARLVGEVLGKYHPHGDTSVYDAMVRMAQNFSMRYPLVDGQGNFGSIDNDPPAAMRYTEARLRDISTQMLADLDRNTVNFSLNFDDSLQEPTVLPSMIPNLLVNGASGIAVGMATSIPPHNLREICNAINYQLENPEATVEDLLRFVKGPDFPTGGIIMAGTTSEGIKEMYRTGRGRVLVRAKTEIQSMGKRTDRDQIVVTEIPYQVNKASLVERIAILAKDKKIDGISEVRDESDRQGLRIVIELRGSAQPEIVLNNLYKHTALQSSFNMNMLALVDNQPKVLNIREAIGHFIDFRSEVVRRRAEYDLEKAQSRAHIVEGLLRAIEQIDLIINLIRNAENTDEAKTSLIGQLSLSEEQAQAILEMQLRRLTGLDTKRLQDEFEELTTLINDLQQLLASSEKIRDVVQEETKKIKDKFGDKRYTEVLGEEATEYSREQLEPHQDVVITLSQNGYIKRIPLNTYKMQHRGGKGVVGMRTTKDDDIIQHLLVSDTHDTLLFFTSRGQVFSTRSYEINPDISRTTRGTPLPVLIPALPQGDKITALVSFPDLKKDGCLVLSTKLGQVKRVPLAQFSSIRSNGIFAMKNLGKEDELVSAIIADDDSEVIVVTDQGMSLCFGVSQLIMRSRAAGGVRAIRLKGDDRVIAIDIAKPDGKLFTATQNGFGKMSKLENYRRQGRGGSGVIACKITPKTGPVTAAIVVEGDEELVIATAKAQIQRVSLSEVGTYGRYAKGVWIMRPEDKDRITAMSILGPQSWTINPNNELQDEEIESTNEELSGQEDSDKQLQLDIESPAENAEDEKD